MRRIVLFLLCSIGLHAEIIEIKTMQEIHPFVGKESLIIFDIDNTIMETQQTLGSNQWFEHRFASLQKQKLSVSEALEKALHEWSSIQNVTEVKLVEPNTAAIIRDLQSKGFTVMGLTTRGLGLSTCTLHQLERLNVDLSISPPSKSEIHFMNDGEGILYRKGILFTSGTNKGKALQSLLEKIGFHSKKIVFINDKYKHLHSLEVVYEKTLVSFIGLRYGFLDDKVQHFPSEIAQVQFSHFGKILSDQEASKFIKKDFE